MRKLIFLLPVFLFFISTPSATQVYHTEADPDTTLSFVYTDNYREISKDSHHYTTSWSLKNGKLIYDYNYGGFPGPEILHDEILVSDSVIQLYRKMLKELRLYLNYNIRYPVNKAGMTVESGKSLYFTDGKESFKITIDGGRPININDEKSTKLSEFKYFVEHNY